MNSKTTDFEFFLPPNASFFLYSTHEDAERAMQTSWYKNIEEKERFEKYKGFNPKIVSSLVATSASGSNIIPVEKTTAVAQYKAQFISKKINALVSYTDPGSMLVKMKEIQDGNFPNIKYWLIIAGNKFGWIALMDESVKLERLTNEP